MKKWYPILINFILVYSCQYNREYSADLNHLDSLKIVIQKRDSTIKDLQSLNTELSALKAIQIKDNNKLYGKITPYLIKETEFSNVINEFDTIYKFNDREGINYRIFNVCNGESDNTLPFCNCSDNIYIGTSNFDLPNTINLFKLGPFMECNIEKIDEVKKIVLFSQNVKGKRKKQKIKISINKITLL